LKQLFVQAVGVMKKTVCFIGVIYGISLQVCDAGNAININFNNGVNFINPVDWVELQVSTASDQDVTYTDVGGTGIDLVVDSGNGRTANTAWDGWSQEVGFRTKDGDSIFCDISNIPYSRYKIIAHVGNADSPQSGSITLKSSISINFNNGVDFVDATQFAGISGNTNWVEQQVSTLSDQNVSYTNVGGTGIDLVVDSGNGRTINAVWDGWAQEVGFQTKDGDTIRCDISNIPYSRYKIIAYVGNADSPQSGRITLGDTTYYFSGSSVFPVPSLIQSADTNDTDGIDAASYVIFGADSWLTGSSQTITVTAISGISMFGAIEIVPDMPETHYFSGSAVPHVPLLLQSTDTDDSDGIDAGSYVVFGSDENPLVGGNQTVTVKAISGVSMFNAIQIVSEVPGIAVNINFNNGVDFIEVNHSVVEVKSSNWVELEVSSVSDQDVAYTNVGGTGVDLVIDSGNGRAANSAWVGWPQEVGFRTKDGDIIFCNISNIPYLRYKIIAQVGNSGSPQTGMITLTSSVNINFNNGADFIDPDEFTGLSENTKWIELQVSTLSDQDISYPNVGGTGIDLVVDSGNGRAKNSAWDGWAQEVGFRTNLDADTIRCDIHNIPFSRYRIIAHVGNYGSPQTGMIMLGGTTYYFSGSSVSPAPSLLESSDTNDGDGIDAGSYVIFGKSSGWLTGSSQTITVSAISGVSMLGGIEIIPDMPGTYYFSGSAVPHVPLLLQSTDTDDSDGIDAGSYVVFGSDENPLVSDTQTVIVKAIEGVSMFGAIQIVPEIQTLKLFSIQSH
jgi:hypothetical protein